MDAMTNLVDRAATIAIRAARAWAESHPEAVVDLRGALFAECLRANLKIRLPEALRDAREAIDAGMGAIADTTFAASVALAGVDAAKESCALAA